MAQLNPTSLAQSCRGEAFANRVAAGQATSPHMLRPCSGMLNRVVSLVYFSGAIEGKITHLMCRVHVCAGDPPSTFLGESPSVCIIGNTVRHN